MSSFFGDENKNNINQEIPFDIESIKSQKMFCLQVYLKIKIYLKIYKCDT